MPEMAKDSFAPAILWIVSLLLGLFQRETATFVAVISDPAVENRGIPRLSAISSLFFRWNNSGNSGGAPVFQWAPRGNGQVHSNGLDYSLIVPTRPCAVGARSKCHPSAN